MTETVPTPTSVPQTIAQYWAAGRQYISAAGGFAVGIGLMSNIDVTTVLDQLDKISGALGAIVMALGTIVTVVNSVIASRRASPGAQVESVKAMPVATQAQALAERPEVKTVVVADETIAKAAPSNKVVAQ